MFKNDRTNLTLVWHYFDVPAEDYEDDLLDSGFMFVRQTFTPLRPSETFYIQLGAPIGG